MPVMTLNPRTLPSNDNINPYAYCVDVRGDTVIRNGKMIAYYGHIQFESLARSGLSGMLLEALNSPNLLHSYIRASGQGKLILGDNRNHIASYDVENASFTMRAENLLGFSTTLKCQKSTVDGYLTLLGSGKIIASSNGPVVFLEPPCRCDPDAVLGWADMPSPSWRHDHGYIKGILDTMGYVAGVTASGEEKQLDFVGTGNVLIQSSELPLWGRSNIEQVLTALPGMSSTDVRRVLMTAQQLLGGH